MSKTDAVYGEARCGQRTFAWYHHAMLEETIPFADVWERTHPPGLSARAVRAFVRFMEGRLGARFVYDRMRVPFQKPELLDLFAIAEQLKKQGSIHEYHSTKGMPDEPQFHAWSARLVTSGGHAESASGANFTNDRLALTATLAEAAERHVWFERVDHLDSPVVATVAQMRTRGPILAPERFAGFSVEQRGKARQLQLLPESRFAWTRGHSWVSGSPVWVPIQVISGNPSLSVDRKAREEPMILSRSTNGLATGQTRDKAVLAGALELIERDAYMIMWLNQLSEPQFDVEELCTRSESLARLVRQCSKYRLEARAVRMLTDAPAYAVCAVVEDKTGNQPKIIIGLRADKDPAYAFEKALMEALRIRQTARRMVQNPPNDWSTDKKASDISHMDRLLYWMVEERSSKLAFLTKGLVQNFTEPWEQDSDAEHLARIHAWCREHEYAFASVSLTPSAGNPTPWYIEMVLIPELQPIHLHEHARHLGGTRLKDVPKMFGYTPRAKPYVDDPHPFA